MNFRESFAEFFRDMQTKKSMAMLGGSAFGPLCEVCGKRRSSGMLPSHRIVADRLSLHHNGKLLIECAGTCSCPDELARLAV